ncbi:unnamed protein product [Blepharisma stoltei]|uniref:Myosin light chain n=1 Tax=Blepharisma stoltei TaxID=1481888 RepID=A0AAU9ITT5_9CILI|nr:unnamed protein product [Blepharisma stoltei]
MAIKEDSMHKHIFDLYDKEHDLVVNMDCLGDAARLLGANLSDAEIEDFMSALDKSEPLIEFETFEELVNQLIAKDKISKYDLIKRLEPFDKDLDGMVAVSDIINLLCGPGEPLSREDAEEILHDINPQNSPKISITSLIDNLLRNELI